MDDKLERELSAAVERGPEDPAVKKLIGESAQARAYFNGLLAVDRALRGWPAPRAVSEKDSDAFVDAVLARLDEPVSDRDFDPFAVPFADEREAQKTPRQHSEQHAMSQSNDQDNDDDLEGLAALMRPSRTGSSASVPPPAVSVRPGPALADDAMDESSGIVDIKHLAAIAKRASVPPASVDEALKSRAEEKAEARDKSDDKKDEKKSEAKADKPAEKKSDEKKPEAKSEKKLQAVPATTAAPEASEKKGSNPVVWIGLVGIAAAAAFGVSQMSKSNPATSVNAEAPQSAAPSTSASANSAPVAQPAVTQPPAPTPAPIAPTEGTVAAAPAQQSPEPTAAGPTPVAESAQGAQPAPTAQPTAAIGGAAATSDQGAARRAGGSGGAAESDGPTVAAAPRNAATRESAGESAPARTSTATGTSVSAGTGASRGSSSAPTASAGATTTATPPAARPTTTAAATTTPTTGAAPAGGAARPMSVDELMRRATGADRAEEAQRARTNEQAAAQASLPPQLTRSMVSGAMSPFNSQVRACAQGQTGTATAVLTVSGDGSVSNVVVSSPWGSGPNDCITNRLRTARFPAVQRPSSRVVYPFAVLAPQPGG